MIHQLTGMTRKNGYSYPEVKCGELLPKAKSGSLNLGPFSAWHQDVTCEDCLNGRKKSESPD